MTVTARAALRALPCALAALLVGVACGDEDSAELARPTSASTTTSPEPSATSTTTSPEPSATTEGSEPCGPYPPLTVTWLPAGWSGDLRAGNGGDPTGRPCSAYHWAGPPGVYVNVVAGPSPFAIDRDRAETGTVAGRPALLDQIHEGFAVEFTLSGSTRDHPYALVAYGVSRDELRKIAQGLVPERVRADDHHPG